MIYLEEVITPKPVEQHSESILAEIVMDPIAYILGLFTFILAMFCIMFLFAAAGAAQ
jgi:hypothetical protein